LKKLIQTIVAALLFISVISAQQISTDVLNNHLPNGMIGGDPPEPEAMTQRFLNGFNAGDKFGYSVSNAGDVNGDGYDDIIVGAREWGGAKGRIYIYFGGSIFDSNPDVTISGAYIGAKFGHSVSGAGDLNGDGYDDVVIGAPYDDNFGTDAGAAYVYFGGSEMDTILDVSLYDYTTGNNFGNTVSTAGDVNGDGYSDLIISASHYSSSVGRAYIYYGGASMNNSVDVTLTGEAPNNYFGGAKTAGDVNGDGYDDVLVAAPYNSSGGSGSGRVYLYFGSQTMDNLPDLTLTGEASANYFGRSVSAAGDVNGDGYSDFLVTADGYSSWRGRAYLYYGGATVNDTADVIFTGTSIERFGISGSKAGDINGDGYSDILIGAWTNDVNGTDAGRAYIFTGGPQMDNIFDGIFTGENAYDNLGFSVGGGGDVNGDGIGDFLVGANNHNSATGKVYLYLNSLTGNDIADEILTGANSANFGAALAIGGDVNGDGYDDFIVGAPRYSSYAGRAYIYYGGQKVHQYSDLYMTGGAGERYGTAVAIVSDLNGDGADDFIVGAPYYNSQQGKIDIFFGGQSVDDIADITIINPITSGMFGMSISGAGDVNGDGFNDIIIGAGLSNNAYIYYGGSSMDNTADVTLSGYLENFGYSVSGCGDVNGDGYSDVVVGAEGYNSSQGRAYIYYGGINMDNSADVIMTGLGSADHFGCSVAGAGDVNADGYSDVIVGAYRMNVNDTGGMLIYFGGHNMDNQADIIRTGRQENSNFGQHVSTAGDVNNDGYSDVIIGDNAFDEALIYFGSENMSNSPDITMNYSTNYFGISVAGGGDLNNDGLSDYLVGDPDIGTVYGHVYVFLSTAPTIIPRITTIKDVPFDQGGYVNVNFVRSGYDAKGENNKITEYLIEMSNPPGINGFSWSQIGTVQPVQNNLYTFTAHTPNDSMTNNSGTYYFRVTARTSNPAEFWRSNIMSGHSVDNLAPLAPVSFYANLTGNNVHLGWQANTEGDLRDYHIYRNINPLTQNLTLIGTTTDTTFIDSSLTGGNLYYYVSAMDIHNNESPYSEDSITASISANIRVFLEGPYVGGQMSTFLNSSGFIPLNQPYNTAPWNYTGTESVTTVPANDWVLVELRSDLTTVADRRAAFIKNDGSLVELDGVSSIRFPNATTGDYYVVIIHRNHLSVMTAQKITISFSPVLYDMRSNPSNVYGTNAVKDLQDGNYGMVSGDANGNGQVQNNDSETFWAVQNGQSGYKEGDYNLNGQVQNNDRETYWVPNNGRGTQVPAGTYLIPGNKIDINTEVSK